MTMFWIGFSVGIASLMVLALALVIGYRIAIRKHRVQMYEFKNLVKTNNNKNVVAFCKSSPQWMK